MRRLSRTLFGEMFASATLGCVLFTFIVFLEKASQLFEFLVRDSGSVSAAAKLFALVLPEVLPYSIPLGALVGTLITLSRMSADGEITAMRACGVPARRVGPPILAFGFLAMCVAAAASLVVTPWSIHERYALQNQLRAKQMGADVEPRRFMEDTFPNNILYVNDVKQDGRWEGVLLADVSPSPERRDNPILTLAREAIAVPDAAHNRVQLHMLAASTYEARRKDGESETEYTLTISKTHDQSLEAKPPGEVVPFRQTTEMDTGPLYKLAYRHSDNDPERILQARIELNQRLSLPLACILLALAGIPLGVGSRRSGSSFAYVMTVGLAFLYYLGMLSLIKLAGQRTLPAEFAVWLPDLIFATFGIVMLLRMESPGDRDYFGRLARLLRPTKGLPAERVPRLLDRVQGSRLKFRLPMLPQIVDTYVVASFLFYFVLWLASFVMMVQVFTFFELLTDIIKNHIPMERVATYLYYLAPRLIYEFTPPSVLTAVLVVFGVLSKNNEVTAFKACGVSVYRLSMPILIASLLISGGLFAFDYYWVPEADRRQDAIYSEIKGKPAQTYLDLHRKWMYGKNDRVFYYQFYDKDQRVMANVNVFEIDPASYHLKAHIAAERARWEKDVGWVFENGRRQNLDLAGLDSEGVDDFSGSTRVFPEIDEPKDYFEPKEDIEAHKMNFRQLQDYIAELQRGNFETVKAQVQFYRKFSVPLFAFILALVSVPFALKAGTRGAMAGVGVSIAVFIAYWSIGQFFEAVGNVNQLNPLWLAAWSPDAVFFLVGLYFLARMRS